jgi:hypothetical protein
VVESPYTRWGGAKRTGRWRELTAVWVRLDVLFPRDPAGSWRTVPDGLDPRGNVRGLLSGWFRTVDGRWLGVVNYAVPYADGRRERVMLRDQLVPAEAMSERADHDPLI